MAFKTKSLGSKSKMRPLFESKNFVSSGYGINENGALYNIELNFSFHQCSNLVVAHLFS